ncbi:hypothetical protein NJ69_04665 [Pseudomonas parafulva]|nr:hypothetical protein NJ69_04665 [Pseudomonas parafulva]
MGQGVQTFVQAAAGVGVVADQCQMLQALLGAFEQGLRIWHKFPQHGGVRGPAFHRQPPLRDEQAGGNHIQMFADKSLTPSMH